MSGHSPNGPVAGPECRSYESLLPLFGAGALTDEETADVRRHVATCGWCSRRLAAYTTVDGALRRHVQTLMAAANVQTKEELLRLAEGGRNAARTNPPS